MNKRYKMIVTFVFVVILFLANFNVVHGESKLDFIEFKPKSIEKTTDGVNASISLSDTDECSLEVDINAQNLKSGYYSTYLYENENRDWSNYSAMGFRIRNKSQGALRLNFNLTTADNAVLSMPDESIALIRKDGSDTIESVEFNYGTLEIGENFDGVIYLPFSSFKLNAENNSNTKEISKILSWGILAITKENEVKKFNVSRFLLIPKESEINKYFKYNFSIEGDEIVEIPVLGEGITNYKISIGTDEKNNTTKMKFQLKNPVDGAKIYESGRLALTPEVKPQKLQICAILNGELSNTMEVQLVNSWTVAETELKDSIPKTSEVLGAMNKYENIMIDMKALTALRVFVAIGALALCGIYLYWKRNEDRNG